MRHLALLAVTALALLAPACGGGGGGDDGGNAAGGGSDEEFTIPGDADNGKALFAKSGCGGCHTFAAAGSTAKVGPNLDDAVAKYKDDPDFIRESIIAPGAYVEKGSGGSIGGNREYTAEMPSFGPRALDQKNVISDQAVNDIVVFLVENAKD